MVALVTVLGTIVVALIQQVWSHQDSSSVAESATHAPFQTSPPASPSGGVAHVVRRQGRLVLKRWWGYDLDSQAPDWNGTPNGWRGHDVGYQPRPEMKTIVARQDQPSIAPLQAAPIHSYEDCATTLYTAPLVTEPWVARGYASCVLTDQGRYALLSIDELDDKQVSATVTVWD
ncbi:hypothetical protein [Microbispora amethystogenes]|uniref:Uncharacterized protein n=1 Tax=Microbispora amethystogenes TaxID=1427754 RepID=A0ABQ4FL36_9ACTN|nr:hypothetical protein [Microbispora amethystogenes]GIH35527.1 hypothetical protein Mam01_56910 [Microbispora amethystogenes]